MGYRGRGSFDKARTMDRKPKNDGTYREVESDLVDVFGNSRNFTKDGGFDEKYLESIVKLKSGIKETILEGGKCTLSEISEMPEYKKHERFVLGVALEYMQREGTVKIVGSRKSQIVIGSKPIGSRVKKDITYIIEPVYAL